MVADDKVNRPVKLFFSSELTFQVSITPLELVLITRLFSMIIKYSFE